jgi:hypothetical protein
MDATDWVPTLAVDPLAFCTLEVPDSTTALWSRYCH